MSRLWNGLCNSVILTIQDYMMLLLYTLLTLFLGIGAENALC